MFTLHRVARKWRWERVVRGRDGVVGSWRPGGRDGAVSATALAGCGRGRDGRGAGRDARTPGRCDGDARVASRGRRVRHGDGRNVTLPHETSHAPHWSALCCGEKVALCASKAPQHLGGGDYVPHLRDVSHVPATGRPHPCVIPCETPTSRAFRGGHSLPGSPRDARDVEPQPRWPEPSAELPRSQFLPQLRAADLAADRFRQLLDEVDLAGVLVRGGQLAGVGL
jgi:hypothetical protein